MALIPTTTMKAPFDTVSAGQITYAYTAGSVVADTIAVTGREIVLIYNSGASPYTVTITSEVDEKNRTGNITTYSLAAGEFAYFTGCLTNAPGWKNQSTGLLAIVASNAAVKWAVLKLPAGYPG
jgi:hypothetical protein